MKEASLQAYFSEAATWEADRAGETRRSARRAWLVAGAGCMCVLALSVALLVLMPLKRVEPFVVRVDNTTGVVDVVPVYAGATAMPEAITRYFLSHYVSTCERFNFATAESDYEECGAFHSPRRNQEWYAAWNRANPNSPLNLYKDGATIRAQVTSVSFFSRANGAADLAQVRYIKAKRNAGGSDEQLTYWIATIQYAFVRPPEDPRLRRWNPLGFKVIEYRPEPEVASDHPTAPASEGGQP
jgi:type IV secretion system protein VirB8